MARSRSSKPFACFSTRDLVLDIVQSLEEWLEDHASKANSRRKRKQDDGDAQRVDE